MEDEVRDECLKRLKFIEGHLAGVRKMVEEDKYCVDVMKQSFAVRRALEKVEDLLLQGHLHHCVVQGIRDGREEQVLAELMELYKQAHK